MPRPLRIVLVVLAFLAILTTIYKVRASEKKLDSFAKCLASKNARMYGAATCPHCADQKEMFGTSFQYVPYTECLIPGTHNETDECKSLKVRYTPTWIFADGQRHEGTMQLQDLANQTGCKLP